MKLLKIYVSIIVLSSLTTANAQYEGGNGDGFCVKIVAQETLSTPQLVIYRGGRGDGFSGNVRKNTSFFSDFDLLYTGGAGDGYHSSIITEQYIASSSFITIYSGGNGDGFGSYKRSFNTIEEVLSLAIYGGGNGDGYDGCKSSNMFIDGLGLTIFSGGAGDGYSKDYRTSVYLNPNLYLSLKVILQGAQLNPNDLDLMNDSLRQKGLLPSLSPYSDSVSISEGVFNEGGVDSMGLQADDIVDWVWVALRDDGDSENVLSAKSALVQRDGDVVALDGISSVRFQEPEGNYYLSIDHQNHLRGITATSMRLVNENNVLDFTDTANSITATNKQTTLGLPEGKQALWAGDANDDGAISYNVKSEGILSRVLNDPSNPFKQLNTTIGPIYDGFDTDLDGEINYNIESNLLLDNILNNPSNPFKQLNTSIEE